MHTYLSIAPSRDFDGLFILDMPKYKCQFKDKNNKQGDFIVVSDFVFGEYHVWCVIL